MKSTVLDATERKVIGKKVKTLRKTGQMPITVYGKDIKSHSLSVGLKDFQKVYSHTGETGLVELKFGKETLHTLITDVQFHVLSRLPLHAQLHAVNLSDKIRAKVPVELVGEAPVVVSAQGLLLHTLNEIEVEALPTDLPEKIEIDISQLSEVGQQLCVSDLKSMAGVEILTGVEEMIVKVVTAVSEETKKEIAAEEAAKAAEAVVPEGGAASTGPETSSTEAVPVEKTPEV